jgi:hypothetical protein
MGRGPASDQFSSIFGATRGLDVLEPNIPAKKPIKPRKPRVKTSPVGIPKSVIKENLSSPADIIQKVLNKNISYSEGKLSIQGKKTLDKAYAMLEQASYDASKYAKDKLDEFWVEYNSYTEPFVSQIAAARLEEAIDILRKEVRRFSFCHSQISKDCFDYFC